MLKNSHYPSGHETVDLISELIFLEPNNTFYRALDDVLQWLK